MRKDFKAKFFSEIESCYWHNKRKNAIRNGMRDKIPKMSCILPFFLLLQNNNRIDEYHSTRTNAQKLRTRNPWNGIVNFYSTDKFKTVKHALHSIFIRISLHKSHWRRVKQRRHAQRRRWDIFRALRENLFVDVQTGCRVRCYINRRTDWLIWAS